MNEHLTMKKMAENIGVSESYYQKVEYGARNPSFNFLMKFKTAFPKTDVDYLFLDQRIQNEHVS
ncbi:MAG: helix-turn-helix domain-containing protein [Bilifractor sp.]